jgi:hypothetical protein
MAAELCWQTVILINYKIWVDLIIMFIVNGIHQIFAINKKFAFCVICKKSYNYPGLDVILYPCHMVRSF